jgi:hypothetical protein
MAAYLLQVLSTDSSLGTFFGSGSNRYRFDPVTGFMIQWHKGMLMG